MKRAAKLSVASAIGAASAFAFAACSSFSGSSTATDAAPNDASTQASDVNEAPDAPTIGTDATDAAVDAPPFPCEGGVCIMLAALDHPSSLALNNAVVYVTEDATNGHVFEIPKDGHSPTAIFQGNIPCSVRVNDNAAYFAVTNDNLVYLAGTMVTMPFNAPAFLEADDTSVVVTQVSQIAALFPASLDAGPYNYSGPVELYGGVALAPSHVFFSFPHISQIVRLDRPGFNNANVYAPTSYTLNMPGALLASDDTAIYVAEVGANRVIKLDSVSLTNDPIPITTDLSNPTSLAADSISMYVADSNGITKSNLISHVQSPLVAMPNITALAVDATYLYFAVNGTPDGGTVEAKTGFVARVAK